MTLFVTHYPQLTVLAQMYPQAKNVHMKTSIDLATNAVSSVGLKYLHEVVSGPCDMRSGYGIIMAEQCGFPTEVMNDAREIRTIVRDSFPVLSQDCTADDSKGLCAMSALLQHLMLLKNSSLDTSSALTYLHELRSKIPDSVAVDMLEWINVQQISNSLA